MSARTRYTGFFAASVLAIATVVVAQQPGQPGRQTPQGGTHTAGGASGGQASGAQQGHAGKTDEQLAAWLLVDNEGEIAAGKIAEQRGESDEVKKFAKQMINEHSQFIEKLQQFAGSQGGASGGSSGAGQRSGASGGSNVQIQNAEGSGQAGETAGNQDASNRQQTSNGGASSQLAATGGQSGASGSLDIVDLKRRLGQRCVASLQRELESKSGRDFDKAYAGQQLIAHMQMLDTLEVFKDFASPQLRSVIDQGIQTTQNHLKHVEQVVKDADQHGNETARTNREEQRQ